MPCCVFFYFAFWQGLAVCLCVCFSSERRRLGITMERESNELILNGTVRLVPLLHLLEYCRGSRWMKGKDCWPLYSVRQVQNQGVSHSSPSNVLRHTFDWRKRFFYFYNHIIHFIYRNPKRKLLGWKFQEESGDCCWRCAMSVLSDDTTWQNNPYYKEHGDEWSDYTGFYVAISICTLFGLSIIILNLVLCCCSPYKEYWRDPDTGNRWHNFPHHQY